MRSVKQNFAADIAALKRQLSEVLATLVMLAKPASESERGSFTLKEFQRRHNLSESQFFKLCREGRGPRLMSVGSVGKRVSREADRDWIAAREQEAKAAKETAPTENETSAPDEERPSGDSSNSPLPTGRQRVDACGLHPDAP
jgi:hypothetical protein